MNTSLKVILLLCVLTFSCRKRDEISTDTDFSLRFSEEMVTFDTVFTTIGSTTRILKVYNVNNKPIQISSAKLAGGSTSQFRMNIDGYSGENIKNIFIPAKDSIFVFIEVRVDPTSDLSPFIVEDSIVFETNGNVQSTKLIAYGQNAIYYTPTVFSSSLPDYSIIEDGTVWTSNLPIVIYGYAVVDSAFDLTIQEGTQIYMHANAGLWVYRYGQINVKGTKDNPVVFQGDRLEQDYEDISGQWDRIWINEGNKESKIDYAIIKNAYIGLQIETSPFYPNTIKSLNTLKVHNTIIDNVEYAGIMSKNYQLECVNVIVQRCGLYGLAITGGGNYNFYHCSFSNHWSSSTRETPNVILTNYYDDYVQGVRQVRGLEEADFVNCIINGSLENEFDYDLEEGGELNFLIQNSILKTTGTTTDTTHFMDIIKNPTANIFQSNEDFHLVNGSPAINAGHFPSSVVYAPDDYDENKRVLDGKPDLGAFEFQ